MNSQDLVQQEHDKQIKKETDLMSKTDDNSNTDSLSDDVAVDESDEHLPRVRIELEKLNYANESINNLELEYEEAKREFLSLLDESNYELSSLEKKIGSYVTKAYPYYEERMLLILVKQKYLKAKIQFETAQELYVAARNMQMYAEDSLDISNEQAQINREDCNKEALIKMLKMAKIKVSETEFSKQSCDLEQIEAYKIYEARLKKLENLEKNLKRSIEKSTKYYEMKAFFNKELHFYMSKTEGLKSCLKEAKLAYQQSLKNLEQISSEVHAQRKNTMNTSSTDNNSEYKNLKSDSSSSTISSLSAAISSSSPNLTNLKQEQTVSSLNSSSKSSSLTQLDCSQHQSSMAHEEEEEADYDRYFNEANNQLINEFDSIKNFTKTIQFSQKIAKNGISLLSDEEIECLRLEKKLKKFENELRRRRSTEEILESNEKKQSSIESPHASSINRPQFRVSNIFNSNK